MDGQTKMNFWRRIVIVGLVTGTFGCLGPDEDLSDFGSKATRDLPYNETFSSRGGEFTCSDRSCQWMSDEIRTPGSSELTVAASIWCDGVGNFEDADSVGIFYDFDNNGNWRALWEFVNDFDRKNLSRAVANLGGTMRIRIEAETSAPNEIYLIDNLRVSGESGTNDGEQLPYSETFGSRGDFRCTRDTCSWTSPKIATPGSARLTLRAETSCIGEDNFEASDYLRFSYRFGESGDFRSLANLTGGISRSTLAKDFANAGAILQVRIDAKTSATNETYVVDNLEVFAGRSERPNDGGELPFTENFSSRGGAFSCSDRACEWTSGEIDVAGADKILIEAKAECEGASNFEDADTLSISYQIDDGQWRRAIHRENSFSDTTLRKSFSNNGRRLRVRINAKTSNYNEVYRITKLTVKEGEVDDDDDDDPPTGDWQCHRSYYGTGDGCDCGCGARDPDCDGRGCTGQGCSNSACDAYHDLCPRGHQCVIVPDNEGVKWTDVEKDPNESHDNLFCWVAGPANILAWSGWNAGMTTDEIFVQAQDYWPPNDDDGPPSGGDDAYAFLEWFFIGDQPDEDYPRDGGHYRSRGFPGYCGGRMGRDFYVGICPSDMEDDEDVIMDLLDEGYAAAIQMKGYSSGGHVITLWGYSKRNGEMTGVFLTDSDDDKGDRTPPDRFFWRPVEYEDGIWHIRERDGSRYKWIKYVYGLRQR